jgi:type I restriction enzyme S subunit
MTRWRPYPEYKDSGAPWLGEIPVHWEVANLKYLLRLEYGDSLPADSRQEGFVPVFGSNGPVGTHSKPNTLAPVLVLGRKGSHGKVNFSDQPVFAIDTTYYVDSRSTKADLRWLFYTLQLLQLDAFSQDSAVPGLSREFAYQQRVPEISLPEQRAIAAFLDHHTAKIDALIAEQRRLIELLQERRAALISHAVTKGLDHYIPMKDSDFPWLGEIPLHWETRPLWTVAYLQRGHDLPSQDRIQGEVPVVSSSGVSAYHAEAKAKGPGVVTGRYGTIGEVFYIEQDYWPLNTALYVRDFYGNHPRYIYYLLTILPFDAYSGKSAVPGIDRNDLHPLPVVCPPVAEQSAISAYLDHKNTRIDALIAEIETGIAHLEEYRTTLISAAVTGKIDVRDALPADAPAQPCLPSP